jgi:hypothetical protein
VFEQYAAILRQKYPEISVEGDLYPPPDYKAMLARALVCDHICLPAFSICTWIVLPLTCHSYIGNVV